MPYDQTLDCWIFKRLKELKPKGHKWPSLNNPTEYINNQATDVPASWLEMSKHYKCHLHTNNRGGDKRSQHSISDIRLCLTFKLQVFHRCEFGASSPTSWVGLHISFKHLHIDEVWVDSDTMAIETSWPSLIQLTVVWRLGFRWPPSSHKLQYLGNCSGVSVLRYIMSICE